MSVFLTILFRFDTCAQNKKFGKMSDIDQSSDKCYYFPRKVGDAMSEKEWLTVKETAGLLNISRRQVINKINSGQLKAKRNGRLWLIHESLSPDIEEIKVTSQELPEDSQDFQSEIQRLEDMMEFLRKQLEEKDQQINQQQAIIMQLSRNQQMILESAEQKKSRSWWQRLRNRQQKETD